MAWVEKDLKDHLVSTPLPQALDTSEEEGKGKRNGKGRKSIREKL